jgi:hypothetical protein
MSDQEHDNVRAVWSEDELDRALAALRPSQDPEERAHRRARSELLVAAGAREPVTPAPEPRPKRRWGWWVGSAATVAAVTAGVLVVQTVQLDTTIPSAAAEQLNSAADRTGATDEPLGPGQYRYIATHAWWMASGGDFAYLAENLLETWVPADQEQDWLWRRDVTGATKRLSGQAVRVHETAWPEGEWRAPCGDWFAVSEGRTPCSQEGSWQVPTAEFLAALPRNPDRLYERLRGDTEGKGSDADLEVVVYVADVLRTGLVPADLRAALYRALAKVDGLQITERVANVDGRRGTAYGISAAGRRHDVIVDPATGQFIGERQLTEDGYDDIPAGTVTEYTSVTTTVVPGIGVAPTG